MGERGNHAPAGRLSARMTKFTDEEKAEAAEREAAYRRRVYVRLVQAGRMSPISAKHQIAMMEEIASDYRERSGTRLL